MSRTALLSRALRLPLRLVPAGARLPVLRGPLRGATWIAGSAPHACWLGRYERHVQAVLCERIRPGDVACDVGANVGYFTLLMSRLCGETGKVLAFEPHAPNLVYLRRHLDLNRCTNVTVVRAAVGARSGRARFAPTHSRWTARLDPAGELEVEVVSLDALLAAGTSPPAFVKIDAEGAEIEVLRGAGRLVLESGPAMVIATHGRDALRQSRQLLAAAGYSTRILAGNEEIGACEILALPPGRH